MLRRFVAASMIGSIAIAIGAVVILLIPGFNFNRTYPLIVLWCFVPCIWGLWAMVAPTHWVPDQLPYWGAALGLVAATIAIFSLNLPARYLGIDLPVAAKVGVVMVGVIVYYGLWSLVKVAYHHLHHEPK